MEVNRALGTGVHEDDDHLLLSQPRVKCNRIDLLVYGSRIEYGLRQLTTVEVILLQEGEIESGALGLLLIEPIWQFLHHTAL